MSKQFYYEQFSLAQVQFNVKNSSIWNDLVQHTKTFRLQAIQFSISTQFKYQNISISNNSG